MKALTYQGVKNVGVETVDDPEIHASDDIIVKVTATAIDGADLLAYRGRIPGLKPGDVLGREFMGIVEETGSGVTQLAPGDRVVVPFVIACGHCRFCDRQLFAACDATSAAQDTRADNTRVYTGAALFGSGDLYGGVAGGQAEYVRVPRANAGPVKMPESLGDERVLFLGDSLPTAYQAVLNAGVEAGSSLAIFGAGPVGLMAAACARMLGVEALFMIDDNDDRLQFAADAYDAVPIRFDSGAAPAAKIIGLTDRYGVDAAIDAVGFDGQGNPAETMLTALRIETGSTYALRQAVAAVRRGGIVSIAGFYAGLGHGVPLGEIVEKGIAIKAGRAHVQRYMSRLLHFIEEDRLHPEAIVTHRLPLSDSAAAYHMLDQKHDACRKIVLTP